LCENRLPQSCKAFIDPSIRAKLVGKYLAKLTHPFKNAAFQSIFAGSASVVTTSEKVQLVQLANRKFTTSFPMNLR